MADGKVDGTLGSDTMSSSYSDSGGDSIDGADGNNDTIYGYGGGDQINAGLGDDTVYGGTGNDTVYGGSSGNDLIYGRTGDDYVSGDGDNDTVYGGRGRDTITGDTGDDVLYSESGDDELFGGQGNDYIWITQGTRDYIEGNSGDDTIDFSTLTGATATSLNFYGGSTSDGYVIFDNAQRLEFRSMENIVGLGDGTIDGTAGSDSMGAGYDDGGLDYIGTGDGSDADLAMGYGGSDTIASGSGDDTLYGGAANDSLYGGSGDDHIYGDSGDDYLVGGSGSDTLYSGLGNDTFDGGSGMDYVDFGAETSGVSVDFNGNILGGAASGNVFGSGIDGIYGTAYDDTISGYDAFALSGDAYTNIFYGRGGNDILNGRGGPDELYGGSGDDTFLMTAGPGNDTIEGGEGGSDNDVIDFSGTAGALNIAYSGAEAGTIIYGADTVSFSEVETISMSSGADTVTGSAGAETIYGEGGNDNITMADGADSVSAGAGSDTVYGGSGNDSLSGDSGDDTIYGGSGADVLAGSFGSDFIVGNSGDDTILGSVGGDRLEGYRGNDSIYGGSGEDSIYGWSGDDAIYGGTGNDDLFGYSGDDTLYGGAGLDTLTGGAGNDSLYAASGDDLIYGGSGDDYFTITGMNNYALYGGEDVGDTDFDVLDISSLGNAGQVSSITYDTPDKSSGTIAFTNGDSATFEGFEQVICFARGTRLLTDMGYRRVESLREGDMLQTRDHGLQPIRWIGRRRISATGDNAPVVVTEGTWGANRPVKISPQHRLLLSGWQAEVLFGEAEVLIPAKHLVDGRSIRRKAEGPVVYFHVCLDRHEIICADGVATESFLPGDMGAEALPPDQMERLCDAIPQLREDFNAMVPARPLLKGYEAEALRDLIADAKSRPIEPA